MKLCVQRRVPFVTWNSVSVILHLFQSSLSLSRRHKTHFDIMWRHDFFSGPRCIWRVSGLQSYFVLIACPRLSRSSTTWCFLATPGNCKQFATVTARCRSCCDPELGNFATLIMVKVNVYRPWLKGSLRVWWILLLLLLNTSAWLCLQHSRKLGTTF